MTETTPAIIAVAAGDLRREPRPLPEPGQADAVVRVSYGGICGSDLHYWRHGRVGESILREPLVLGHEIIGVVERAAADGSGPAVGTEVFIHPASVCGACEFCRAGRSNLCPHLRYLGSAARFPHTQGGFADRIVVDAVRLRDITGVPLLDAALIEPAAVAWHAVSQVGAVARALTGRIAVIGAGPIGLLVIAALAARSSDAEIIATDLHESARRRALSLGATRAIAAGIAVDELAAEPPSIVFETSGSAAGFDTALRSVQPGGMVVAVGQLPPAIESAVQLIVGRELVVTGSSRFADEDEAVFAALREGRLRVDGVVTHTRDAAEFAEAFEIAADASSSGKVLLSFGSGR